MTAATMVDGRQRTPPVTLIHATAVPAGWLLARVLTVGISSPKWHLKCEVMAVLVAQAPQAGPRTQALALLPSLDIEVIDPRAKSDPVRCSTKLTGVIKSGESDLQVGCLIWNFCCSSHRWHKNMHFWILLIDYIHEYDIPWQFEGKLLKESLTQAFLFFGQEVKFDVTFYWRWLPKYIL